MKRIILSFFLVTSLFAADPTESREWSSTAGTQIEASALSYEDGIVVLKTAAGREIKLPAAKLIAEDRAFLAAHFGVIDHTPVPGKVLTSAAAPLVELPPHPIGEITGPISAEKGDSSYFLYLPKSLRKDRKAPLFFYTSAGGGNAKSFKRFLEGAEINGWIVAVSVQSKNGPSFPKKNHEHSVNCVEHLLETLPIDAERVFFSGDSGGGAMALFNALRIDSAGIMPLVGYSLDRKYKKHHYCYGIGGAADFNRYVTAAACSGHGERGFHRFVPGTHSSGDPWFSEEGMIWLNGRHLGDRRKDTALDDIRLDYEASVIERIKGLTASHAHRAHYLCHILKNDYKIEGHNASILADLMTGLEDEPINVQYTAGLVALDEFSEKIYVKFGEAGTSLSAHTTPKIIKAVEELVEKYPKIPDLTEIIKQLADPTKKF